jgi:hypothetical protein
MCTGSLKIEYGRDVRIVLRIQEHVMFSKIQERTQSQRCEFQNKVINEFNCGIYRLVTTLYLQQLILKFVYFRSCL